MNQKTTPVMMIKAVMVIALPAVLTASTIPASRSLSLMVSHNDNIVESQMHNCMVDEKEINKDTFQVLLTVEYIRD